MVTLEQQTPTDPAPAPAPDEHGDRPRSRTGWSRDRTVRAATVLGVLVALEVLVFHEYLTGRSIPPWDFLSHYNTEAYAWWRDGSFFSPPDWMPYLWGGYPGALNLQNSSWYLPVGITATLTTFDLHASAVLSALHVGFGALGMYVLGRRWGFAHVAAVLGLVAWFFVSGFYAHGSHLDIMRGYAWLPWVLLVLSPQWPWRRWWAPPLAGLLLWQALLAMYPGALIAAVYTLAVWVLLVQLTLRPRLRDYLVPLAVAVAAAAAMTLLRFLPFALVRGFGAPAAGDASVFSWGVVGTLFYPYGDPTLPNDITMRSLFIPVTAVVLAGLVAWRTPVARVAAGTAAAAVVLGVSALPWAPLVELLPGMELSRFRLDDFKVVLLAATCVLAMAGAHRLVAEASTGAGSARALARRLGATRIGYLVLLVVGAAVLGLHGPFTRTDWLAQWSLVLAGAALVAVAVMTPRGGARVAVVGLTVVTLCSGLLAVEATPTPWRVDRAAQEAGFGAPVDDLVARGRDAEADGERRPPRARPGDAVTEMSMLDTVWGGAYYTREPSVLGYVNLKGTQTFETMRAQFLDPAVLPVAAEFWSAPGIALATDGDGGLPDPQDVVACAQDGACGPGVRVTPVSFALATPLVYDVTVPAGGTTLQLNEAYYPGWAAEVCVADDCSAAPVRRGDAAELLVDVPGGTSTLTVTYRLPGMGAAWVAFGAGLLVLVLWPVGLRLVRRLRPEQQAVPGGRAHGDDAEVGDTADAPLDERGDADPRGRRSPAPSRAAGGSDPRTGSTEAGR